MKYFLLITLFVSNVWAQKSELVDIQNSEIVCVNSAVDMQVEINTKLGKIWLKKASSSENKGVLVKGAVFSGIYSADRYMGEVVGEVNVNDTPAYITIIMREVKSEAQLELFLHPLENQMNYSRMLMNNCRINK